MSITNVLWTIEKLFLDHDSCILKNPIRGFAFVLNSSGKVQFIVTPIHRKSWWKNWRIINHEFGISLKSFLTNGCGFKMESSMNLPLIRKKYSFSGSWDYFKKKKKAERKLSTVKVSWTLYYNPLMHACYLTSITVNPHSLPSSVWSKRKHSEQGLFANVKISNSSGNDL